MKKLAIIVATLGVIIAISSFIASANSLIGIKTFFKLGLGGIFLMILASVYFLISTLRLRQNVPEFE
ncbi:hypothetical protein ACE38W_08595 [Chitinophaga sp. Hz27]|uniref:hypothetical protein n=1 Tax=Chitinophaga sp. Hz27 TaxID=3347169 RepID=UPI0035DF321E